MTDAEARRLRAVLETLEAQAATMAPYGGAMSAEWVRDTARIAMPPETWTKLR